MHLFNRHLYFMAKVSERHVKMALTFKPLRSKWFSVSPGHETLNQLFILLWDLSVRGSLLNQPRCVLRTWRGHSTVFFIQSYSQMPLWIRCIGPVVGAMQYKCSEILIHILSNKSWTSSWGEVGVRFGWQWLLACKGHKVWGHVSQNRQSAHSGIGTGFSV